MTTRRRTELTLTHRVFFLHSTPPLQRSSSLLSPKNKNPSSIPPISQRLVFTIMAFSFFPSSSILISVSALFILFIFSSNPIHLFASAAPESKSNQYPVVRSSSKAENSGGAVSQRLWCVAKNNADDSSLQRSLDWACGPGGADCSQIQQGRSCYDPSNFQSTASYAFNDYFRKHGDDASCDFAGTAALSSLDPSHGDCKFPYSVQAVSNGSFVASANGGLGPASADYSGSRPISIRCWGWDLITAVALVCVCSSSLN